MGHNLKANDGIVVLHDILGFLPPLWAMARSGEVEARNCILNFMPLPSEGYGVWDTASDIWITSAAKMRLLADSQTPALDINVDTWAGVVTLFGIVPSQQAKAAAAADVGKVSGVKHVVNELQVVASTKQAAGQVRDEEAKSLPYGDQRRLERASSSNLHKIPNGSLNCRNAFPSRPPIRRLRRQVRSASSFRSAPSPILRR